MKCSNCKKEFRADVIRMECPQCRQEIERLKLDILKWVQNGPSSYTLSFKKLFMGGKSK